MLKLNLQSLIIILLVTLSTSEGSTAAPAQPNHYRVVSGLVDIPDGSYVEGSHRHGGIQPDYKIDHSDPNIKRLIRFARRQKDAISNPWTKISSIMSYIRDYHLTGQEYDNKNYLATNRLHLEKNQDVNLGSYSVCRAGVCRENALYLNLALREAGIENYHAYAQIKRMSRFYNFERVEDHAFVVAKIEGQLWVLDSYYSGFNGFKLEDIMSTEGITEKSILSPVAKPETGFRRIQKINSFPLIHIPLNAGPVRTLRLEDYIQFPIPQSCEHYLRTQPAQNP